MTSGLPLVIDKSTLQSLSINESSDLGRLFHVILTPTLFMEIRADLLKASRHARKPEKEVAILSDKLHSFAASVNLDYYNLCVHDLMGDDVEMRGRPIIGGAQQFIAKDGRRGIFIDEPPEMKSLRKWSEGNFDDDDWEFARAWRDDLNQLDLNLVTKELSWTRQYTKDIKSDGDVLAMIDHALGTQGRTHELLKNMMGMLRLPKVLHARITEKWEQAGKPMIGIYAPYATHVTRVDMFFYSALARGLLSPDRPSDKIDLSYLYYLPFCRVFASNDNFHKRIVPLFLTGKKKFIDGAALKSDLASLRNYYDSLPEKKRSQEMTSDYPPLEGEFLASKLYDHFRPGWRARAKEPPVEITPEINEKIMQRLRPMMDAIEALEKKGK